jgi:hypothetical protein
MTVAVGWNRGFAGRSDREGKITGDTGDRAARAECNATGCLCGDGSNVDRSAAKLTSKLQNFPASQCSEPRRDWMLALPFLFGPERRDYFP